MSKLRSMLDSIEKVYAAVQKHFGVGPEIATQLEEEAKNDAITVANQALEAARAEVTRLEAEVAALTPVVPQAVDGAQPTA